jgi:hypothetical protein
MGRPGPDERTTSIRPGSGLVGPGLDRLPSA